MKSTISLKKHYVRTDGWRGYEEPIYAAAGANDTGTWSDSPCPSNVATEELNKFKAALRKAGIKYRETATRTSNIFCVHRYVVVAPADLEKAKEIAQECTPGTRLFYVV